MRRGLFTGAPRSFVINWSLTFNLTRQKTKWEPKNVFIINFYFLLTIRHTRWVNRDLMSCTHLLPLPLSFPWRRQYIKGHYRMNSKIIPKTWTPNSNCGSPLGHIYKAIKNWTLTLFTVHFWLSLVQGPRFSFLTLPPLNFGPRKKYFRYYRFIL